MIGLDSNIILRAVLNDDAVQSPRARSCLKRLDMEQRGFIATGVLLEIYWVFDRRYKLSRNIISHTFNQLLQVEWLEFENFDVVVRALDRYKAQGTDLSDALISEHNRSKGCSKTLTFDQLAARKVPGMVLLT